VASWAKETKTANQNLQYIRLFYLLSVLPGPDDEGLITIGSSSNQQSASGGMGFTSSSTFLAGVANSGCCDWLQRGTTSITVGLAPSDWTCVELEIDATYTPPNTTGLTQVWHNGSSTPDPQLSGTADLQNILAVEFGMDFVAPSGSSSNAVDLYIDDIAIDSKYIDCNQ
jgi:hypothetical protein